MCKIRLPDTSRHNRSMRQRRSGNMGSLSILTTRRVPVRDEQPPRVRVNAQPNRRLTTRTGVVSAVFICSIVTSLVASQSAPNTATVAHAAATDIYEYAGECVTVRDQWSNRYVVRDAVGYALYSLPRAATPFRMQATDLGSYLLYGPDARMPAAMNTRHVASAGKADARADWVVTRQGAALQLTNVSTRRNLSVAWAARLI